MSEESTATISLKRYNYLLERDRFLSKLEAAGVDNWEGYSEASSDDNEESEEDIYGENHERHE